MTFVYDGSSQSLARAGAETSPSHAVWEITLRCDLACSHCGSRAGRVRKNELSTDEALDVVRQLAELGVRETTLIGGEFYLRDDWDRIAREIVMRGMYCSVVTGARSLTEERVVRAADAGVDKISLSIDGLERTHDAIRGIPGSWRSACAAAKRIVAAGIELSANTQLNRLTVPELPAVADVLNELGARSWMVILTAPMGRAADRRLHLEPYHLLAVFPLLADIKKRKLDPRGIALFPANNVGYATELSESLRYGAEQGAVWSGCSAGVSTIGLEADGTVKGCPSLPTAPYARGNVREDSIAEVALQLRREKASPRLWGFCARCPHSARCQAGCTWTSHVVFGQAGNNPFCHNRAVAKAKEGKAERLVPAERAPGQPFDFGRFDIAEISLEEAEADPLMSAIATSAVFGLRDRCDGAWSQAEMDSILS